MYFRSRRFTITECCCRSDHSYNLFVLRSSLSLASSTFVLSFDSEVESFRCYLVNVILDAIFQHSVKSQWLGDPNELLIIFILINYSFNR